MTKAQRILACILILIGSIIGGIMSAKQGTSVNGQGTNVSGGGGGAAAPTVTCSTANGMIEYLTSTTQQCSADFTIDATAHTFKGGAAGIVDLSGQGQSTFKPPLATGSQATGNCALSAADTWFCHNIQYVWAGAAGFNSTICSNTNQVLTAVSALAGPTCTSLSAVLTSDYTNATAGATNVTGLSFPIVASKNYAISCKLIYQGSASTTTMTLNSTGPASPTKVTAQTVMDTTSGSSAAFFSGATDGTTFAFALGPPSAIVTTATDLFATLDVGIINGVNAGTWQLTATDGTGTLTIRAGSFCTIQ
jgi:hypothetical protein